MTINSNKNKTIWSPAEFIDTMVYDTFKFQEKYGYEISPEGSAWNNEGDAFRHAYMQAYLTLRFGETNAKLLGNWYEQYGSKHNDQEKSEEIMDLHNNSIGREIGNEIKKEIGNKSRKADQDEIKEIIARKVAERMQAGKLILDPSGRRTPKKKLNIPKDKQQKNTLHSPNGCVGSYHVSGYTRSDGTEVKGYTRTCGAKHSGMSQEERFAGQAKYKGKRMQDLGQSELEEAISYFI